MKYKNLVILGTSHIARQSLVEVRRLIEEEKPDIIAIELDARRLAVLMSGAKPRLSLRSIRKIGVKGFVFSLLGAWAERKLGRLVGVAPGSEMRQAVKIARKENIEIALVDQDIEVTLRRLSASITWKEKMNFVVDIIKALFAKEKVMEFDLTKVPESRVIKKLTDRLKQRYPNFHKVLIEERNHAIARNIKGVMDANKERKIVAILGAGHVDDVMGMLKKDEGISYSFTVSNV